MTRKFDPRLYLVVNNIRKVREHRNYTQDYIASKLHISQNAYSKVELGLTSITINRIIELAIILEVEVKLLLKTDYRFPLKPEQIPDLKVR